MKTGKEKRLLSILLNEERTGEEVIEEAVDALRTRGHTLHVCAVDHPEAVERFVEESLREGVDVIVAMGGDGTLNQVLHAMHGAQALDRCAVGVLPGGTANDFATACGIPPDDPLEALTLAAEAPLIPIDVGRVNGRLFINAASGGYGAEVTATTPPGMKKMLGGFAYLVNGLIHIPEVQGKHTRILAPGFEWEGNLVGFTVGNGRQAGGGFNVTPHALINDGLLDLTLFPEVEAGGWTGVVGDLLHPSDDEAHEYLVTCQAPRFEISVQETLQVNLDGEPFEDTVFRFDVLAEQALFCLPSTCLLTR